MALLLPLQNPPSPPWSTSCAEPYTAKTTTCPKLVSHGAELNYLVRESAGACLSMKMMQILLPAGLDVNYNVDRQGGYLAAFVNRNDITCSKYLLDQGADPNQNPLTDLFPALNLAVLRNNAKIVELLVQYGAIVDGLGALGMAARHRRFEMMDLLLDQYGADVNDNVKDRPGVCAVNTDREFTALHEAAFAGHADVVAYLIKRGANPEVREAKGRTPSMLAQENGRQQVVRLLDFLQA